MRGLARRANGFRLGFQRLFSPKVEESPRLRAVALASLWLAALALIWVGGHVGLALAGALLGTVGHWLSWRWRRRPSRSRPLLIALLVISISFFMRSQMVEVFAGNWLPLAHFLSIVLALSSFDLRTRGGLYTGLALSGIVIFLASQQAFSVSFGIFVIGFVALLLAFLTLTFLEDAVRDAQVHRRRSRWGMLGYLTGTGCAVFALSWLALWMMPRGEGGPIGPSRVAVLPYTDNSMDGVAANFETSLADSALTASSFTSVTPTGKIISAPDGKPDAGAETAGLAPKPNPVAAAQIPLGAFLGSPSSEGDGVVMFVRSKVTSYWRGQELVDFDGRQWWAGASRHSLARQADGARLWYDRDNAGLDATTRYHQTFFMQRDQPNSLFMGYRGLQVIFNAEDREGPGVTRGETYRVVSAQPQYSPERLRRDFTRRLSPSLAYLPPGSERVSDLARQVTEGATSDFDRAGRIVSYLAREGNSDPNSPGRLTSPVDLEGFLFEGEPGSSLDYATATVILARASGLPARLAAGYLPGFRDPLSGVFAVREKDAHAWAEIYFAENGWVPFDASPRAENLGQEGSGSAASRLFQSNIGDGASGSMKAVSIGLFETLRGALGKPALYTMISILTLAALALRLLWTRRARGGPSGAAAQLAYTGLPGEGRRELLDLYFRLERMLRRKARLRRAPWQTVGDHTSLAAANNPQLLMHLSWFAQAVWQAAYNPRPLPAGLAGEGLWRFKELRSSLGKGRAPRLLAAFIQGRLPTSRKGPGAGSGPC